MNCKIVGTIISLKTLRVIRIKTIKYQLPRTKENEEINDHKGNNKGMLLMLKKKRRHKIFLLPIIKRNHP